MPVTKSKIIAALQANGFTRQRSDTYVETTLSLIKKTLASGEDVRISGFGKFCVRKKHARKGRNPATGDDLILRARKVVTFKCSGKLNKRING